MGRKRITVERTHEELVKALHEMNEKTIENGSRKIIKEVMKPYREELDRENKSFKKHTGRLSGSAHWRKAAKLSVTNSSVSSPGTVSIKRSDEQAVLGYFYVQKMEDIEKKRGRKMSSGRNAYMANTNQYSAWINFGVKPHRIGRDSIRESNIRSRERYYVNRISQYQEMLASGYDRRGKKISRSYQETIEGYIWRMNERLANLPRTKQTGGTHPGFSARNYITRIRSKIKSKGVTDLADQMQTEVRKFLDSKASIFQKTNRKK